MAFDDKIRDEKLQHDIHRDAAKISALSTSKIEILPSDHRRVIEQAKSTYSPLAIALEKQTKAIEYQDSKRMKTIEDHGKQLVESNELIKKDFDINRDRIPLEEQKKYLMNLLKKVIGILEKRINHDNLIYKYKTEGRSPKEFRNYQNPIRLFKNLRDGNTNPKEVLKNQINFKSDQGEIKK